MLILELVAEAVHSGARLRKACDEIGVSLRTYQRWSHPEATEEDQRPLVARPEPTNKLTQEETTIILETVHSPEFASKPPSQIVPVLADQGVYLASESTFYRILRAVEEQNHRGRAQEPRHLTKAEHRATAPNLVWSWDITYLPGPVKGIFYYLYLFLDIFSRDIVGWEVWAEESAEHASHLIARACLSQGILSQTTLLILHSDNGSPMKGATMLETLYRLGITPSRSRPSVSNDNPYSESLFRTCKYRPEYPGKGFATLEDARNWVSRFVKWYRFTHRHSGLNFVTPQEVHSGKAPDILAHRHEVYQEARKRNPQRWRGNTRNWSAPTEVWLNPREKNPDEARQLS